MNEEYILDQVHDGKAWYYLNTIEKQQEATPVIKLIEYIKLYYAYNEKRYNEVYKRLKEIKDGQCFLNALIACEMFNDDLNYIEGVLDVDYKNFNTSLLVHHAWCYSRMFKKHVEITFPKVAGDYYIAKELKGEELKAHIERLKNTNKVIQYALEPNVNPVMTDNEFNWYLSHDEAYKKEIARDPEHKHVFWNQLKFEKTDPRDKKEKFIYKIVEWERPN